MVPEADLTSKWGRFLLGVYWWHQKQSSSVVRPCLNVIIIQCYSFLPDRWRFWFFKITLFKRVCTFRQIVLLFNYHIITHAAYLDEKKFQQRPKFQNCVKDLWYWFAMRFPMLELTWTFKKKLLKSWRTLFRVDISSTFCWFELMSGRTNVLTP